MVIDIVLRVSCIRLMNEAFVTVILASMPSCVECDKNLPLGKKKNENIGNFMFGSISSTL